ncbi:MAG TPA: alpha/beta fold hydrolase, partial [Anaerolineae bacterium]|nr:alpha/beta fold hydrolase [Anaerolineae bacterium]
SMGGMVAQHLAVTHPERVRKLVLAETALGTRNTLWERIQTSFAKVFLKLTSQETLVNLSARQYGSLNPHVGAFVRHEMERFDRRTSVRVMSAAFGFSGKSRLKDIVAPTLVLVAAENKQTHAQGRELAERIPHARLEILPRSHHLLNLDNPDAFNAAVLNFLREQGADRKPAA